MKKVLDFLFYLWYNEGALKSRKEMIIMNDTKRIDHRRNYILMLDTETANTATDKQGNIDTSSCLVYDCGWIVADTKGNIYERRSYVNRDIFCYERKLMQSAYYGWKIPRYVQDLQSGKRVMADTLEIRKAMLQDVETYGIKYVCAHNALFDYKALNSTLRYVTKGYVRNWFPFGSVEWWDSLKMARTVLAKMPTYKKFCQENNLMTKNGRVKTSAEACYRFILNDSTYVESHTGLEDVLIEYSIMLYCYRQHKSMEKRLFKDEQKIIPNTNFQTALWFNLKDIPVLSMGF